MTTNRNVSTTITVLLRAFIAIVAILAIMSFVGCSTSSPTGSTTGSTETTLDGSDNPEIYRLVDPDKDGNEEDAVS